MGDVFERSPLSLLQRLRPAPVRVEDLREAAATVLPDLATAELRLSVVDRAAGGSVVVLEERERRVQGRIQAVVATPR